MDGLPAGFPFVSAGASPRSAIGETPCAAIAGEDRVGLSRSREATNEVERKPLWFKRKPERFFVMREAFFLLARKRKRAEVSARKKSPTDP